MLVPLLAMIQRVDEEQLARAEDQIVCSDVKGDTQSRLPKTMHLQASLKDLQRGRPHSLSGKPVPVLQYSGILTTSMSSILPAVELINICCCTYDSWTGQEIMDMCEDKIV